MNGGVSRSRPVSRLPADRDAAGGVEDLLDERGDQRGLGGGVLLGPDHVDGAAGLEERLRVQADGSGGGEGVGDDVGVGEAADGVAEGLPDAGAGLVDDPLGFLQGAADRGELRVVTEDGGGFGVGVVLAPPDEVGDAGVGEGGGEEVGGHHVDGAAFEERMIPGAVGAGVRWWWRGAGPEPAVSRWSWWCSRGSGSTGPGAASRWHR